MPERREAAVGEFQICGRGRDWAFARTDRQIIEAAALMWGGIARPDRDAGPRAPAGVTEGRTRR